ncbi:hypothetical protein GCM10009665_23100 [Kitasatospora nipponensis]|uniref:Uncharacterized protein n=1 Tax=Kitasatospora nipponensis TaxID=258049 RepID=A0ABN1W5D0_9ACTN
MTPWWVPGPAPGGASVIVSASGTASADSLTGVGTDYVSSDLRDRGSGSSPSAAQPTDGGSYSWSCCYGPGHDALDVTCPSLYLANLVRDGLTVGKLLCSPPWYSQVDGHIPWGIGQLAPAMPASRNRLQAQPVINPWEVLHQSPRTTTATHGNE